MSQTRVTLNVHEETRDEVRALKRGNDSYDCAVNRLLALHNSENSERGDRSQ